MYDLVCVGEALVDFVTTIDGVSLDDADTFKAVVGGSPTNVALTAARLGSAVALVAAVGDDPLAGRLRAALDQAGVVSVLSVVPDLATTAAVVVRSHATPSFAILRGADTRLDHFPAGLLETGWIHTSAFALSHDPQRSVIVEVLKRAGDLGIRTSLDVNYHHRVWREDPEPVLPGIVALVDVVKVSSDDCERLFGPGTPASHVARLQAWGARAVLLTQGGGPVIYVGPDETCEVPVPRRRVADVTGAGDALMAGFIIASLDGLPTKEALAVGVETAGRSVEALGHLPDSRDREALYDLVRRGLHA